MVRETKIAKAKRLCHSILGANHLTFEGGGGFGRFGKKIPCSRPRKEKKSCMVSSEEKISCMDCAAKKKKRKNPASHRHFSMGWLVGANPCP